MTTPHSQPPDVRDTSAPGTSAKTTTEDQPGPPRPSATAVLASAMAAISSTAALSFLGVAGTIIGVGLSSVLTVLGNYLYGSYLRRTRERVRAARAAAVTRTAAQPTGAARLHRQGGAATAAAASATHRTAVGVDPGAAEGGASDADTGPDDEGESAPGRLRTLWLSAVRRHGLGRIVATIVGVFALLLGVVTVVEAIAGKPVADVVRNEPGSGTSVFGTSSERTDPAPGETIDPEETTDPQETGPAGEPTEEAPDGPAPEDEEPAPDPDVPVPDDQQPPAEEPPPGDEEQLPPEGE